MGTQVDAEAEQIRTGAGVHRKDQRQSIGYLAQRSAQPRHGHGVIHIARTVQREHTVSRPFTAVDGLVSAGLETAAIDLLQLLGLVQQVVDHHMAHIVDCGLWLAFAPQVGNPTGLGDEKPVRDAVGDPSVDFLRHRHVAAAQPRFHMRHRYGELLGDDRARQRGVHIANHQHGGWPLGQAEFLEGHHDLGRLLRVASAACRHEQVGRGYAELIKEDPVHRAVVMLPGVDYLEGHAAVRLHGANNRRDLHEVGPRTGDQVHGFHQVALSTQGLGPRL